MNIFQPIRDNFAIIGVVLYQKCPLNLNNLRTFFALSTGILLNCIHLFCEASTFREYADSFCDTSIMILATLLFMIMIWKTRPLYQLLNDLEYSVTASKFKSLIFLKRIKWNSFQYQLNKCILVGLKCKRPSEIYNGIKEYIHKMDHSIELLMKCLFPCIMLSKFIPSYFAYFTTDLGGEAFELLFPYW